jgi:hypothetical protein
VEITAADRAGRVFTEHTFIEDVSDFGCRFSLRCPVQQGDTVAVKPLGSNGKNSLDEKPQLFEVMWIAPKTSCSTIGARLLQGEKLANVKFPPDLIAAKYQAG